MDAGDRIGRVSKDFIWMTDPDSDEDSDPEVYEMYDSDPDSDSGYPGIYEMYDSASDSDSEEEWEVPDS